MKRISVSILLAISLIVSTPPNAFSASPSVKNGAKCSKLNATSVVGNIKFKCVKKSGKLVWKSFANTTTPQKTEVKILDGLKPEFSKTYTALQTGFTIEIVNFDSLFDWECLPSIGLCTIDVNGKAMVTGFEINSKVTIILKTVRSGYESGVNSITFTPNFLGITPIFQVETVKSLLRSIELQISNYDSTWVWKGTSTSGAISISDAGKVLVSNLTPATEVGISVTATKTGYLSQTTSYRLSTVPDFKELSQREWQLINKDPEGSKGQYLTIYGKITQFDTGTGLSAFRADVAGQDITSSGYWIGGDNTLLSGDQSMLKLFVTGDKFVAKVKVLGTYSYTSIFNGNFTIPHLQIFEIRIV